jgi:hypothetical protein
MCALAANLVAQGAPKRPREQKKKNKTKKKNEERNKK